MDRQIFSKILCAFLLTRVYLLAVGLAASQITAPGYTPQLAWQASQSIPAVNVWCRWDSGWYLSIVELGYVVDSSKHPGYVVDRGIDLAANKAFFPLYPLLVKLSGALIRDHLLAGVLLSNICLLAAVVLLYELILLDYPSATALRTVYFALIYPVSFILSGFFSESLFLALTVGAFYAARKRRWMLSGAFGFLSALTRSFGALIIIPIAIEYASSEKAVKKEALYLLLIPLGTLLFFTHLYLLSGDVFSFSHTQELYWRTGLTEPVSSSIQIFAQYFTSIDTWVRLIFLIFAFFGLLYMLARKVRASYLVYSAYAIMLPIASSKFFSLPRFTLVVFPLYIVLGLLSERKLLGNALFYLSSLLMTLYMMLWVVGSTHII